MILMYPCFTWTHRDYKLALTEQNRNSNLLNLIVAIVPNSISLFLIADLGNFFLLVAKNVCERK